MSAWPTPTADAIEDESDRQMVLLALAELALRRPGWGWTIGRLADRLEGRAMLEQFKTTSSDLVAPDQVAALVEAATSVALDAPCLCEGGERCARHRLVDQLRRFGVGHVE